MNDIVTPFESYIDMPTTESLGAAAALLPPERCERAFAVRDWMLMQPRIEIAEADILEGLYARLDDAGVAIDRAFAAFSALHSQNAGYGAIWVRGEGSSSTTFPFRDAADNGFDKSPFFAVNERHQWLKLRLDHTPDSRFAVVPELKRAGYVGYLCIPVFAGAAYQNGLAIATRRPGGFSDEDIAVLMLVMPAAAAVLESLAASRALHTLLRIYIGDEPHLRVLAGEVRRGQVARIRSAILFADMRSYTALTMRYPAEEVVTILNDYFDCLVPAIEEEGGEVLKYMGDGLLAIFRDRGDDTAAAAQGALTAARKALGRLSDANTRGAFPEPIRAGIALHHGRAAYGNVGSGMRLDFTVVGRDVNIASRVGQLNRELDEPLIVTRAFADQVWADFPSLGSHHLPGLTEPIAVYRAL